MRKLIKANLFYYFSKKMLVVVFVFLAIYSSVVPLLFCSRNILTDAAKYLSSFVPSTSTVYYFRINMLLIVITIIIGIMVGGIFKNGMIYYQKLVDRNGILMWAMVIASWIIVLIFLSPIIISAIVTFLMNGARNIDGECVPFIYILITLLVLIIDTIHIETNAIVISYILRSEIKGFIIAIGFEMIKSYVCLFVFLKLGGIIKWSPYGLFPLTNCIDIMSRVYWTRTNVPLEFDLGLPFIGFIIDVFFLMMIMAVVKKIRLFKE